MEVENGIESPIPATVEADKMVGLNIGISGFYTDSAGNRCQNPTLLKRSLNKLAAVQCLFARKKRGSKSRAKQWVRVAAVHNRVANQRLGFMHQESARRAVTNQATHFAVESLTIKGMDKNHRLSRAIADGGWGMFLNALAYQCHWNGNSLLKIERWTLSRKRYSNCGSQRQYLPLSVREWQCACGAIYDRDPNGTKMMVQFALAESPGACAVA